MNYEEYSEQKCQELRQVQDAFKAEFKIDSYAHWFYDSETELLRLYNDQEDEIHFRYIPIGTFSLKSHTWMWSWFNEHSIEKNKNQLLAIRDFGIDNKYQKLLEGTFSADEYDGWELSSICLDFLNGIGVYKVDSDGLQKFMLVTAVENMDSSKIRYLKQKTVECGNHGSSRPAFVCGHLNLETIQGFEEAFDTYKGMGLEEDEDFQAWCNDCEKIRLEHDGWNEESEKFAQIKLVCENCYFDLKEFNQAK